MKKLSIPIFLLFFVPLLFSCSSSRFAGYTLNQQDAALAIRQLLENGARESVAGAFNRDAVMTSLFPEPVRKTLNTIQQLGLTNEVDRFTNTLGTASEKAATASVPVFVSAINNMQFADAMNIIKRGGTSATDYLRSAAGTELRNSLKPVMESAIAEYKLNEQWDNLVKPVKGLAGNRLNLDLPTLMAGMVSEAMFRKIAEKETEIRNTASARATPLLQKVFSRNWN